MYKSLVMRLVNFARTEVGRVGSDNRFVRRLPGSALVAGVATVLTYLGLFIMPN